MEITRIFTDSEGGSHFEVIPVLMTEKSELGYFSEPETKVIQMFFRNARPHHEWDFHHAGHHKLQITILTGEMEFEVSNGEKKRFGVGQVILLDDHSGKGHKVTTFDDVACIQVIHLQ